MIARLRFLTFICVLTYPTSFTPNRFCRNQFVPFTSTSISVRWDAISAPLSS